MKARIPTSLAAALFLVSCAKPSLPALPDPDEAAMLALVARLAPGDDARIAGTEGEAQAARTIAAAFESLGLETRIEDFPIVGFRCSESGVELSLGAGGATEAVKASALMFSPPTPAGGLAAQVAIGGFGSPGELGGVAGKIALIERGRMFFKEKARNAAAAGAVAVIAFDRSREELQATLIDPGPLPVVGIGGGAAALVEAAIAKGEAPSARIVVRSEIFRGSSRNVIARLPGSGGSAAPIVVGAHLDSVGTPGALDNASGLACLVEAAKMLSRARLGPDLYFVGFGAEELGDLGSRRFVESGSAPRASAMLALDTVGSAEASTVYSRQGERNDVVRAALAAAADLGLRAAGGESEASDHAPFAYAGIPAAFIMREPEDRYHTDADSMEAVRGRALVETARLAARTVARLAAGDY